ncbi:hypothetical protein MMC25_005349 [Agyrium rufum]|nr:hypothetical protein [Agyrium rufum]
MGKLNYTNRKIDGLKLGQVVAKDLLKRLPSAASYKAALRDPSIDLDVTGRDLTDAGLAEVASALIRCINIDTETSDPVLKLEEICLKGNALTAKSLVILGDVVAWAANDLRDLDLSNNEIMVKERSDVDAWEYFLSCFKDCCVLRRIDFGGNGLEDRAFEILSKVYCRETSLSTPGVRGGPLSSMPQNVTHLGIELGGVGILLQHKHDGHGEGMMEGRERRGTIPSDKVAIRYRTRRLSSAALELGQIVGNTVAHTFSQAVQHSTPARSRRSSQQASSGSPEKDRSPSKADVLAHCSRTSGLRSIPYILLRDTNMTETGALHVSYILTAHLLPDELMKWTPAAKAGLPMQQLESYNTFSGCRGIIYLPNEDLSSAGTKVLELAELARDGALNEISNENQLPVTGHARRISENIVTHATGDLDRARSRIQGNALRDKGPQSNDLWHASLKMLTYTRAIMLKPSGRNAQLPERPDPDTFSQLHRAMSNIQLHQNTNTASPLTISNPNLPMFDGGYHRAQPDYRPGISKAPSRRKMSIPPGLMMTPITSPCSNISRLPSGSERPVPAYRSRFPKGLSWSIWKDILCLAAGGKGVLDERQVESVLRWGRDRKTLERKRESLGKMESVQMWRVLEGMGCLEYGRGDSTCPTSKYGL